VLACAEGDRTHTQIASELGCNPVTVSKWRHPSVSTSAEADRAVDSLS
jgi:transposase-like protein